MFLNSSTNKFIPFTETWQIGKVFKSRFLFTLVCVASIRLWFPGSIADYIVRSLKDMNDPNVQSSHRKSFEIVTVAVIISLFIILLYMVLGNNVNF